jgi:hypothetical protein
MRNTSTGTKKVKAVTYRLLKLSEKEIYLLSDEECQDGAVWAIPDLGRPV